MDTAILREQKALLGRKIADLVTAFIAELDQDVHLTSVDVKLMTHTSLNGVPDMTICTSVDVKVELKP